MGSWKIGLDYESGDTILQIFPFEVSALGWINTWSIIKSWPRSFKKLKAGQGKITGGYYYWLSFKTIDLYMTAGAISKSKYWA